jgi:hypothetical protein
MDRDGYLHREVKAEAMAMAYAEVDGEISSGSTSWRTTSPNLRGTSGWSDVSYEERSSHALGSKTNYEDILSLVEVCHAQNHLHEDNNSSL